MNPSRGPLVIAIAILLLPFFYVGSYLAFVVPGEIPWKRAAGDPGPPRIEYMISSLDKSILWENYRCGDRYGAVVFCPLEQIDRRLRPNLWNPPHYPIEMPSYAGIGGTPDENEVADP